MATDKLAKILDWPNRKEAFLMLTKYYENASDAEREKVRESWDFERKWIFPDQKKLACKIDGEASCEDRIKASLIYDSIEDMSSDFRVSLIGFCIVYHSALEIGLDADIIFKYVAGLSSGKVSNALLSFIGRNEEDKSLEAFCLRRVVVNENCTLILPY